MSQEKGEGVAAQATIQRQAEEIDSLRARLADERLADDLKRALVRVGATGAIASQVSYSRLQTLIVEASIHVTSAHAGALFLIDEKAQELFFEVSVGPHAAAVKDLRLPIGHGIAGVVAATGQPMIVANVEQDSRHAADIARVAGFSPKNILCVPLEYNDRIIGVLEVLDKQSGESFQLHDMELLGLFAKQAAVAIELSSTCRSLITLLASAITGAGRSANEETQSLLENTANFVHRFEQTTSYKSAMDLAGLLGEIVWNGESELVLCDAILRNIAQYVRSRQNTSPRWLAL
jgi:putative methionine-R-sulfoxide reductase with GAF domain